MVSCSSEEEYLNGDLAFEKTDHTKLITENSFEVLDKNKSNEAITKNKLLKNANTKKPTKKRVVKKVKEVLNENSRNSEPNSIEEKNKKKTSVSHSLKSGWWARKV